MAVVTRYEELSEEQRRNIVFFTLAGSTPSTISSHLGVAEPVVNEVISSFITEEEVDEVEKNHKLDLERMGRLSSQLWAEAARGDQSAAFSALSIMDRRAAKIKEFQERDRERSPAQALNESMRKMMSGVEIPDDPEEEPPSREKE
jgi:hypothetical protein